MKLKQHTGKAFLKEESPLEGALPKAMHRKHVLLGPLRPASNLGIDRDGHIPAKNLYFPAELLGKQESSDVLLRCILDRISVAIVESETPRRQVVAIALLERVHTRLGNVVDDFQLTTLDRFVQRTLQVLEFQKVLLGLVGSK